MRTNIFLPINLGKEARTSGIDWGSMPIVWDMTQNYIVLKIEGHMGWSGRGEQTYRSTTFYVGKLVEKQETYFTYELVIDFPMRQKFK